MEHLGLAPKIRQGEIHKRIWSHLQFALGSLDDENGVYTPLKERPPLEKKVHQPDTKLTPRKKTKMPTCLKITLGSFDQTKYRGAVLFEEVYIYIYQIQLT